MNQKIYTEIDRRITEAHNNIIESLNLLAEGYEEDDLEWYTLNGSLRQAKRALNDAYSDLYRMKGGELI